MSGALAYLEDVEEIADEKSSRKRRELLYGITDIFLFTQENHGDADIKMFGDVMERIAYELEVEARTQLSQKICKCKRVSRPLVVRMANDDIQVAQPLLENSSVLQDPDLIDIIRSKTEEHRYSIAGREMISPDVSGELVEHGDDGTLTRVTGNDGAKFTNQTFEKIADRALENKDLHSALRSRRDIPSEVVEKIKVNVSDRMKEELHGSEDRLDDGAITAMVDECAEDIDLDYCQESIAEINKRHESGDLTEEMVSRLARQKRIPDLVHCLALLSELDNEAVSQCLLKAELPALAILCKANNFKSSTFLAIAEVRSNRGSLKSTELAQVMRDYDSLTFATSQRIMRFLKVRLNLKNARNDEADE